MAEIVAKTQAQAIGRCTECNTLILEGNPIYKVAGTGRTTAAGNGPGRWVCPVCAWKLDPVGMRERLNEFERT